MATLSGWRGAVIAALEEQYPLHLAEPWDNVGLLVDALDDTSDTADPVVMLTNDLTEVTLDEAIAKGAALIVTYHPRPFGKFKRLTREDTTQRIVLRLARAGIAVWSPHTACDNAKGGVNDWLAKGLSGDADIQTVKRLPPQQAKELEGVGSGRIFTLTEPTTVGEIIARVKTHLSLSTLRVAPAAGKSLDEGCDDNLSARLALVRTVAVQAGSGVSVLSGCAADVWVTGEASHHELLEATSMGTTVILAEHSNTERGYLSVMRDCLLSSLHDNHPTIKVLLSTTDHDPISMV